MSRRTFPRAAAGLIAAALGTPSPAAAQAPNPWRGETAARRTAPAPRAVTPAPTRQLVVGFGLSSTSGIAGTFEIRDLTPCLPLAPAPREVTTAPAVNVLIGTYPVAAPALKPIAAVTAAEPTGVAPATFPFQREIPAVNTVRGAARNTPKPVAAGAGKPVVVTVGYTQQLPAVLPRFMPPPAPLPGQVQAPAGNVLIPVEVRFVAPPKGVVPVWAPTTNAVPPIPSAQQ
jgi:hypothetical protein